MISTTDAVAVPMWKLAEIERNREVFNTNAYLDSHGVYRWLSNGAVPFDDLLADAGVSLEVREVCRLARKLDNEKFFKEYLVAQASRTPEEIGEERACARAAMGPGQLMVNVLTGERFTT
jgi:hypothetical protein